MTDSSGVKRQLPILPHPDHLRKQAKARLVSMRLASPECRLADAQRALAQEYGFATWAALQAEVTRRATAPVARQIRTRRRHATLHTAKAGNCTAEPAAFLARRRRAFVVHLDDESIPPQSFLRAGVLTQVCFAVAALVGVGIVCFAVARAAVPYRSDQGSGISPTEVLREVI